jgi:hypothetical protein
MVKKQKCLAKHLIKLFCIRGFHYKWHFQYAFDDKLSAIHVFLKQIFRAVELAPSSPSQGCAGVG